MTNEKRKRPLRFTAERSCDKHKTIEYKYNLINFYRITSICFVILSFLICHLELLVLHKLISLIQAII